MKKKIHPFFFNTETRSKEPLKTLNEGKVSLYTCGPTVYNFAHIGNFRTYVFEDLLRRSLQHFGYHVTQVMNITDVDDKTIRGATEENKSLKEFVEPYERAFFQDLNTLHIQPAEHYPAATDHLPEMIAMIEQLLQKGVAYIGADKSVYFSIGKFARYGCLSHLKLDELVSGASERVQADEYDKENASDFVLWKSYDESRDGKIFWSSPFGPGRPGWHLECSAMAIKWLGETIDIHVGGVDNIFPHHENEIAQSEACSGKRFVNLWLHAEHLIVDGKKMSKKLGNFYTLRDLLEKGFSGKEVRYLLMQTHYRTQLNFTLEGLYGARAALQRLHSFVDRLRALLKENHTEEVSPKELADLLQEAEDQFDQALADDLNISVALATLFDLVREVNSLCDQKKVDQQGAEKVFLLLKNWDAVLSVLPLEEKATVIPEELLLLAKQRDEARKEKKWSEADRLRDLIQAKGYTVEDTPRGSLLRGAVES